MWTLFDVGKVNSYPVTFFSGISSSCSSHRCIGFTTIKSILEYQICYMKLYRRYMQKKIKKKREMYDR